MARDRRLPRESSRCLRWRPTGDPAHAGEPVDFLATMPHWLDHLAPIWHKLSPRGRFWVAPDLEPQAARLGVEALPLRRMEGRGPVAVASYADLRTVAHADRGIVLFEHGAGFSFSSCHPSYAGGTGLRSCVSLFACVNEYARRRNLATYPRIPARVVGCPKLDAPISRHELDPERPVVGLSFHWDCRVAPETRSAWPHFATAIPELLERFELVGHAHPRERELWARRWEELGVEYVEELGELLPRVDVYVNDASSTAYEAAAWGLPVVILNAPWYRRGVHHGLRFWEFASVGVNCDHPADLAGCLEAALCDPEALQVRRRHAVEAAYPVAPGSSAERAAELLLELPDLIYRSRLGHPREPIALGAIVAIVGEGQAADLTRASVEAWHGAATVTAASPCEAYDRAQELGSRVVLLRAGLELSGELSAGLQALERGWAAAAAQGPALDAPQSRDPWALAGLCREIGTDDFYRYDSRCLFLACSPEARAFLALWEEARSCQKAGDWNLALTAAQLRDPLPLWLLAPEWAARLGRDA